MSKPPGKGKAYIRQSLVLAPLLHFGFDLIFRPALLLHHLHHGRVRSLLDVLRVLQLIVVIEDLRKLISLVGQNATRKRTSLNAWVLKYGFFSYP